MAKKKIQAQTRYISDPSKEGWFAVYSKDGYKYFKTRKEAEAFALKYGEASPKELGSARPLTKRKNIKDWQLLAYDWGF